MADLRHDSSNGEKNEKGRPTSATIQAPAVHEKSRMDLRSSGDQHQNPRVLEGSSNPGSSRNMTLDDYASHFQTKADQITHTINTLLSAPLFATINGINVDVFMEGGLVRVKDCLVTALPFALSIFLVIFGPPALVS